MKTTARHFLFAAVSSLSLAACAAQPGVAPIAAAPALTGAPLDTSIPSQLPRIARPLHYDINVVPDAAALRFTGEAGIDIELYAPSAVLTLNALDLSFASASLTGADGDATPLTATTDAATQTVTFTASAPLAPGKYRLRTSYTGTINTQANGLFALDYPDKVSGKEVRGLFTQFEAPDARRFVPSFDEPSYKATFTLAATDPAAQTVSFTAPAPLAPGKYRLATRYTGTINTQANGLFALD